MLLKGCVIYSLWLKQGLFKECKITMPITLLPYLRYNKKNKMRLSFCIFVTFVSIITLSISTTDNLNFRLQLHIRNVTFTMYLLVRFVMTSQNLTLFSQTSHAVYRIRMGYHRLHRILNHCLLNGFYLRNYQSFAALVL